MRGKYSPTVTAADMAQDVDCKYIGNYVAEHMGFGAEEGVTVWRAK